MYKEDLVLNNLQLLICNKTQTNQPKPNQTNVNTKSKRSLTYWHAYNPVIFAFGFIFIIPSDNEEKIHNIRSRRKLYGQSFTISKLIFVNKNRAVHDSYTCMFENQWSFRYSIFIVNKTHY